MSDTKKASHTPGPWEIVIDGTCSAAWPHIVPHGTHIDDVSEMSIAELSSTHIERSRRGMPGPYSEKPERFARSPEHDEIMANARLIAAGPELLECLRWYVENDDVCIGMEGNEFWEDGFNRARSAIAKATGATE